MTGRFIRGMCATPYNLTEAMKQTSLSAFLNKKMKNKPAENRRKSPSPRPSPRRSPVPPPVSRERSSSREGTVRLGESDNESLEVRMGRDHSRLLRTKMVCPCYVMMTPVSTMAWRQSIKLKLIRLEKDYSKEDLLDFIASNLRFHSTSANLDNLLDIRDEHFWNLTAPQMLTHVLERIEKEGS